MRIGLFFRLLNQTPPAKAREIITSALATMPAIAPLVIEELDLDDMEPEGLAPEIELELDAEGDIEDDVD